jgi:hypothetical protein
MTLMKSLLLGSAAGIVAAASAQAADLPTRKGPVAAEYVRVCSITVAGAPVVGFILPGSDTCLRISGYVTGHIEGGNISDSYSITGNVAHASTQTKNNDAFTRNAFGWTTRYNLTLDAVSNTAYGPLVAHGEYQFNYGTGFDTTGAGGSDAGINRAYVTWAGLTAGKIDSFFSFTGGGFGYANFFSPDRKGFNQPDVLAYTASFGGGFAATISLESEGPGFQGINTPGTCNGSYGCGIAYTSGSEIGIINGIYGGQRWPDIVGALSVHQAWGSAQVSGVAHNVRAQETIDGTGARIDRWGWAVDAGVQFNIPSIAGAFVGATGSYSHGALWYSGLPDAMWDGTPNDNGQTWAYQFADAAYQGVGQGWATPDAWSVTAYTQFKINPQLTMSLEGSYGEISWEHTSADTMLSHSQGYLAGAILNYDPVKNLDFQFELLYMATKIDRPAGYLVGDPTIGETTSWHGNSDGFAGRFQVTRSF